jgi:hypothetical protein
MLSLIRTPICDRVKSPPNKLIGGRLKIRAELGNNSIIYFLSFFNSESEGEN